MKSNPKKVPKNIIGPSILNSDLSKLGEECNKLAEAGSDFIHLDVMDGNFVPNITFGPPVVKCLNTKIPKGFLEAHMMVKEPMKWVAPMADAGIHHYTFHVETVKSDTEFQDVARKIRECGMTVGLALNPGTAVSIVEKYIPEVDSVLVMTVEPGFGGQKFMTDMMAKVKYLRDNYSGLDIGVDGGVGPDNLGQCCSAGANMIISGSAITGAKNPAEALSSMKATLNQMGKS